MIKRNALLPLLLLSSSLLTGCSEEATHADTSSESVSEVEETNTDPRQGRVRVVPSDGHAAPVEKYCDGTTLVYEKSSGYKGGLAVVAESNECSPQ